METGLWIMITVVSVAAMAMVSVIVFMESKRKIKELEAVAAQAEKANLQNEVNDAVERHLRDIAGRIEVLEAIVTDRNYGLDEKIARLGK